MSIPVKKLVWFVSVAVLALLAGSAYLVWVPEQAAEVADDDLPAPRVVTIDELQPEEVLRVYLQAWYRRDFSTQYMLLAPSLTATMTREIYSARMEGELPTIGGIRIRTVRTDTLSDIEATVTVDMTTTSVAGEDTESTLTLSFEKTDSGWKIAEVPSL